MAADPTEPLVSVVIAARNAEAGIARLLSALAAQTLDRTEFEVLVVDDDSDDRTAEVVERAGAATLVRNPRRGGSYTARNLGLEQARAPVIAITDADCAPAPEWLESGLRELDALPADLVGGEIAATLSPRPTRAELIDYAQGLDQERCVTHWGFAATANLFARRDVFEAVGHFNPALFSGGDAEFSFRATAAGFRLRYSPAPIVQHELRRRSRDVARRQFRTGFGIGQVHYRGIGPARDRPRMWTNPRLYVPRHGLLGAARLEAAGVKLSPVRRFTLDVAQHLIWRLPTLAGDLAASLRRGRAL